MTSKQGTSRPESTTSYKIGNRLPFTKQQDFGGQALWLFENLFNLRADDSTVPEVFRSSEAMCQHSFLYAIDQNVVFTEAEYTVPHEYGQIPPKYLIDRFQGFVDPSVLSSFKVIIATSFEFGEFRGASSRYRLTAILKSCDQPEIYVISQPSKHVMIYKSMKDLVRNRTFHSVRGFRLMPSMGEVVFRRKYLKHLFDSQTDDEDFEDTNGVI